jgi:serine/threonine protein phosphatase PrpC
MEDAHLCKEVKIPNTNDKGMIFAVFDGHGQIQQRVRPFKKA